MEIVERAKSGFLGRLAPAVIRVSYEARGDEPAAPLPRA